MKTLLLLVYLMTGIFLFSEVVVLNNNEILKGNIIEFNENHIIIYDLIKEVKVKRNNVAAVYFNEADYEKSKGPIAENNSDNKKLSFKVEDKPKDSNKIDLYFSEYKKYLRTGIGFLVPGLILTILPLTFETPVFVHLVSSWIDHCNAYHLPFTATLQNPLILILLTSYIGLISTGLIFDIVSIINFSKSGKAHRKWKELTNITLNGSYSNNALCFYVNWKI